MRLVDGCPQMHVRHLELPGPKRRSDRGCVLLHRTSTHSSVAKRDQATAIRREPSRRLRARTASVRAMPMTTAATAMARTVVVLIPPFDTACVTRTVVGAVLSVDSWGPKGAGFAKAAVAGTRSSRRRH